MTYTRGDYSKWSKERKLQSQLRVKEYIQRHPETQIFKTLRRQKRRKPNFSLEDFRKWYFSQEQKCYYCQLSLEEFLKIFPKTRYKRMTIDRKDNSKGYTLENICLACWTCNHLKGDILSELEMKEFAERILAPKFKKMLENIKES